MTYYEPGIYDCQIMGQGFDESSQKKTPFFWINVSVNADGFESYDREVRMYLTDGTIERALARLKQLGWDGSSFKSLEPGGNCQLAGTIVTLECKHEDGYERWDFPAPAGGGSSEHQDGVARKLDALFGKALGKTKPTETVDEMIANAGDEKDAVPF